MLKNGYLIKVLQTHGLEPIVLGPKEGIALINGTQLIAALGAEGELLIIKVNDNLT